MPLTGRTIALVGLEREEMLDLASALDGVGARWQAFSAPDAQIASGADLIIAAADVAGSLSTTPVPLLSIGSLEAITPFALEGVLPRDFSVTPPLNADEILLRGAHLLSEARAPKPRPSTSTPVVLAADDDATTTAIVRAVVTQHGMTCYTAPNGKVALELAQSMQPNVIVLDVNMPFLDGFQVLSALRNEPRTAMIPVVMLTSMQQEADVVRAFALGADDYVVKPFNPMELLARVRRLAKKPS